MLLHYRFWGYAAVVCIGTAMSVQYQNQSWALARQPRSCSYLWDISINVMLQNCVWVSFFFLQVWPCKQERDFAVNLFETPTRLPSCKMTYLQMQKWKAASLVKAYAQFLCNMEAKLLLGVVKWASQSMSEVVSYHVQATQTRVPNQPSTWVVQSSTLLLWYARALAPAMLCLCNCGGKRSSPLNTCSRPTCDSMLNLTGNTMAQNATYN